MKKVGESISVSFGNLLMVAWTKWTEIEAQFIIQIANVGPSEGKYL